jgi:tetratricopeptide (TPR) repeat protein
VTDYKQINALAKEGLQLWGDGWLDEAADRYVRAIAGAGASAPADWHGAYAGVLNQLGRHGEATEQHQKALAVELARGASDADPSVKMARYFLADHLRHQGDPARALEVLAPSLQALPNDWLLKTTEALALFAVQRPVEARAAAEVALAHASSDEKRAELAELLGEVLAA